jgi:hypothetical protein
MIGLLVIPHNQSVVFCKKKKTSLSVYTRREPETPTLFIIKLILNENSF